MDFTPVILFWLVGLLTTCTALHLWFTTSLPIEIAILLHKIGLLKKQVAAVSHPLPDLLRHEFDTWLILLDSKKLVGRRLAHILQCRGCFSVHAAILISASLLLLSGGAELHSWRALLCGFLVGPASWPWLACRLTSPTANHPPVAKK